MALREYRKTQWFGGLSDSYFLPTENTFASGYNIDIFTVPGLVRPAPLMEKSSGTTVGELCNVAILASDGYSYWFSTAGKIYKRTAAGVWSLVYTDSNGAILGACEFNGYIYWATATKLSRKPFAGLANWSDVVLSWQTLTNSYWHPMCVQANFLVIGNYNTLATVDDSGVFTASGNADITLIETKEKVFISSLIPYGEDVLAGAQYIIDGTTTPITPQIGYLLRWDLVSAAFNSINEVPDNGVFALSMFEGVAIVFAGMSGSIYAFDGTNVSKIKNIQTTATSAPTPANYYYVNPYSVAKYKNRLVFAGVEDSGGPYNNFVYELGRVKQGYPLALSPTYAIGNSGSNIHGAVLSIGDQVLVSTKLYSDSSYGVYASSKTATAMTNQLYIVVDGSIEKNKTLIDAAVGLTSTATADGAVDIYCYPNIIATPTKLTDNFYQNYNKNTAQQKINGRRFMFLISWYGDTTLSDPQKCIDSFYCKWNEEDKV